MRIPKPKSPHSPRWVFPPGPALIHPRLLPANRVLSVLLYPDERVKWTWAMTADGVPYVTGYDILKRKPPRGPKVKRP